MKKRIVSFIAIFLAVLMAVSVLFGAFMSMASASNSATIKKKINNLESEASEIADRKAALEAEIASKESKTQSTIEKKGQIDQQIEITRLEIQNANDQIQEYNLLIAEKQAELDAGLKEQESLNAKYKARIRAMEENGSVSFWSIIFRSSSFSDLLDNINMINEISNADQKMLEKMQKNNEEIAKTRAEMETDRTNLQKKVEELAALTETLETQKQEAEALITQLSNELAELDGTYEELESEEDAIRQRIIQAQKDYDAALSAEQRQQLSQANQNNAAGGGAGFTSPVPRGRAVVTDAYGYRTHPIYGYYAMHSGVDLAAAHGTPIYAIADGYVSVCAYSNVNGNYLSLTHGNGFGSLYAHLDYATVSSGSYVSQGQIIGYMGSTGWSTGPHLHFEIHLNGATVNPMNYISI